MTPEEGKAKLNQLAALSTDRNSWEARAQLIRETILNGANLDLSRDRQPLSAIRRERKVMAGYTVENVAFESSPGEAAYRFIAKHLALDLNQVLDGESKMEESSVTILPRADLEVSGSRGDAPWK